MSITDELRDWAHEHLYKSGIRSDLLAIADRIDAAHEKACDDAWDNGYEADYLGIEKWLTEHPQVMEHHGWVRLPKDADGEYIRIGDVMDSRVDYLFDGKPFTVRALVLCEDGWEVADGRFGNRYEPDSLRHHHAPTVEDVLAEFGIDWEHESDCEDRAALLKEYAAKLRLANNEE